MVDVIFLLIIFFLCVDQSRKADVDKTIELPRAASPQAVPPEEGPGRLTFNVRPNGVVELAGERLGPAGVRQALDDRLARGKASELEVWVRADRRAPYGAVSPILVACADRGIWNVGFKVTTPEAGGGN